MDQSVTTVGTSLGYRIQEVLPRTKGEYYRLVLVVGPARAGKTTALNDLSNRHGWPRLNVNLLLSEKLLDLTQRQRAVGVSRILDEIVRAQQSHIVLLDNIELLFAHRRPFRPMNRYIGNLPPMPGVFPDYPAPVVCKAGDEQQMVLKRWGMPPPPKFGGPPATNVRNTSSPHWRVWLPF